MFISFEGIDGSGKSLQAHLVYEALKVRGHDVILTREPGGTKGAEALRALLLTGDADRWSPMSEVLIFSAARRDHCERVIWPALRAGKIVLCDRFVDSTRTYQGLVDEDMQEAVDMIHEIAIETEADCTFVLDMDPQIALGRAFERGEKELRFEAKGLEFQNRRRAGYLELAKQNPKRFVVVDADREVRAITFDIMREIKKRLESL